MKQPIDFPLFICRARCKADGNIPPWERWLNVILSSHSKHTYHLFSIFLGWHLGIWDSFVKCSREREKKKQLYRKQCGLTWKSVIPLINITIVVWAEILEVCQMSSLHLQSTFSLMHLTVCLFSPTEIQTHTTPAAGLKTFELRHFADIVFLTFYMVLWLFLRHCVDVLHHFVVSLHDFLDDSWSF